MPYSGADDTKLPAHVKSMSDKKRRQWAHVANGALAAGDDEGTAIRKANGVAKNKSWDDDDYSYSEPYSYKKIEKEIAGYEPYGAKDGRGCASCHWFRSPNSCHLVEGAIAQTGMSDLYLAEDEAKWKPEPLEVRVVKEFPTAKDILRRRNNGVNLIDRIKSLMGHDQLGKTEPLPPVLFFKDARGDTRALLVVTNQFKDREGETIKAEAHEEYVQWVEKEDAYPEIYLWHAGPGSAIGKVDFLAYTSGFLVSSGVIYKGKEEIVHRLEGQDLGVSHGFLGVIDDEGVVQRYRSFEFSVLPRDYACNIWTDVTFVRKELGDMPFPEAKRKWLAEVIGTGGDAMVAALEKDVEQIEQNLKKAGIGWKELMTTPPEGAAPATPVTMTSGTVPVAAAPVTATTEVAPVQPAAEAAPATGELATLVATVKSLAESVGAMKTQLDTVQQTAQAANKSMDDAIADSILARTAKLPQGFQASAATKNIVGEEQPNKPEDWFMPVVFGVQAGANQGGS